MNPTRITFGVGLRRRKGVGTYPALEDLEATVGTEQCELGYRFRDYGKLALSIIKRLEDCGTILKAPQALDEIRDFYKLPHLAGSTSRAVVTEIGSFTQWMIDAECPKVGILGVQTEKKRQKKVFFGPIGVLFLKAASKSSNMTQSFEDLVIFRVLARKIRNLGLVLGALYAEGSVDCQCGKAKIKEIRQLQGKKTQISSKLFTTMRDAYLVHCEGPEVIPFAMSSNNPMAISGIIYNEIYRVYHALRIPLQMWISESSKMSTSLVAIDPYEISDRMPRELTRAFEKLELLRFGGHGTRYVSIPDRLLSDLVRYFAELITWEASIEAKKLPSQMPLGYFVKKIKEEFRILINPNDVIRFLEESVDYRTFGMDLRIARGCLISDYHSFTERLENLGLATIRPDGDVMIRIE